MKWVLCLLVVGLVAPPVGLHAEPRFTREDVPAAAAHVYQGGWEHFVGGGVAVLDCDDDGFPDLYAAGGTAPAALLRNVTTGPGAPLGFEQLDRPGIALTGVTGAWPLDIDSDGILDLAVLRVGENRLLRGLGGCRFESAGAAWQFDGGTAWSTAFSGTWLPGQDWPTLAIGNYVDRDDPDGPFGACDDNMLFRPEPGAGADPRVGVSVQGFASPEPIRPGNCALSMLFVDWSGEGRRDLWVSNDRQYYVRDGQEQLFRVDPVLRAWTQAEGWRPYLLWGMGLASRDLTGDGRPEIAVTSMADQKLFTLDATDGTPGFASIAYARGVTAHVPYTGGDGRPSTGWHVQFGDVNNDGRDDLFIAKGNVDQMPGLAMQDPNNLLMQGADGTFAEAGAVAGIATTDRSRGAALVDLNGDGLLDIVVVNRRAGMEIYRNVSAGTGHWLAVALRQPGPNPFAVGARIEVDTGARAQFREVQVGGGHGGGQAVPEHFGLGAPDAVRLRVRWPDGTLGGWIEAAADQTLTVTRDDGIRDGGFRDGGILDGGIRDDDTVPVAE